MRGSAIEGGTETYFDRKGCLKVCSVSPILYSGDPGKIVALQQNKEAPSKPDYFINSLTSRTH